MLRNKCVKVAWRFTEKIETNINSQQNTAKAMMGYPHNAAAAQGMDQLNLFEGRGQRTQETLAWDVAFGLCFNECDSTHQARQVKADPQNFKCKDTKV